MRQTYKAWMATLVPDPALLDATEARMRQLRAARPPLRRKPQLAIAMATLAVGAAVMLGLPWLAAHPAPSSVAILPSASAAMPTPGSTDSLCDPPTHAIAQPLTAGTHEAQVQLTDGLLAFSEGMVWPDMGAKAQPGDVTWVTWDYETAVAHLGWDFRPRWVPPDLALASQPITFQVPLDAANRVAYNNFTLSYAAHGGQDYDPLLRQCTVEVGKGGLPDRCGLYLTDAVGPSNIRGHPVYVGHCKATYGPYDPDTHEPAGTFDRYMAEFEKNGLGFAIASDNLTQEEFIQILLSYFE